jgi:Bacterial protein of unknown function (DUF937)
MATNLVSYIMQFLTPDLINRIAGALGLDRNDTQTGVAATVPALLAALGGVAAKPGGAQSLVDTIKQQSSVVENFGSMLGTGSPSSFVDKGSSLLMSLLGSRDQSSLVGAIGSFAGIGHSGGSSLLGMLTPLVMGLIGKQVGPRLDVGSLSNLFASQKEQIAQALPRGMSNLLGGTGLLDSLSGTAGYATTAAEQAGRATTAAAGQFSQYASSAARSVSTGAQRAAASTTPSWVYWAIPAIVLGGLLWYLLADHTTQVAQHPTVVPTQTQTQSVVFGGVDVGKQINDSLGEIRTSLAGITDAASANAALPKLQEATAQIDKVAAMVRQLPADQRRVADGLVASSMATINQLFDKVLAIPGVAEVVRPTIESLKTKLADLSGPSGTVGTR